MVYFIQREYKSYYSVEVPDLYCPLSGEMEPMRLVLYQQILDTSFYTRHTGRPVGVFFRVSDNKDIPASKWTPEMEHFFEQEKTEHPVPQRSYKLNLGGKIIVTLLIGLVWAFIGWLGYTILIEKPNKERAKNELRILPKKGEQYNVGVPVTNYDSNGKAVSKGMDMRWVEVQSVNPIDSTCVIRLVEELSYGAVMDEQVQKAQQADKSFITKFKIISENEIEFAVLGGKGFTARVYGDLSRVKR